MLQGAAPRQEKQSLRTPTSIIVGITTAALLTLRLPMDSVGIRTKDRDGTQQDVVDSMWARARFATGALSAMLESSRAAARGARRK